MPNTEKVFENIFDDVRIIPKRLGNFAEDSLNNLSANNSNGDFTALITLLTPLVNNFVAEISQVDTSRNVQKGTTLSVNKVLRHFKLTMSSEEPFIARALGGNTTGAYQQFYPSGIDEYSRANKTTMPLLTERISKAATANAAALGTTLTDTLKSFTVDFTNARNRQQQQMSKVKDNRNQRTVNRTALELGLLTCVFSVGAMFPGDVKKCKRFFRFHLLFAHTKHKHKLYNGTLAANETTVVINKLLTDNTAITLRNKSDNAALSVWLNDVADNNTIPSDTVVLQAGEAKQVKPSALGSLDNAFLLIRNNSDVNDCMWEVEVVG